MTQRRRPALVAIIAVVAVIAVACAPAGEDNDRRDAFQAALEQAAPGDTIDLADVLGPGWDRVAVFGPYWTNDDVADRLGAPFDYERGAKSQYNEDGHVVVMASGEEIVAWFNIPWEVDIGCLDGEVFPVDAATLGVVEGSAGFGKVVGPATRPDCYL